MNISLIKNEDAVSGILKMEVAKADYAGQVDKSLRSFRQKANIPGFRKGMVPMGMVRKMYGKATMAEELNKTVSENLFKYIRENNLNVLGEPLPKETEENEIDFDTQENFEFSFDIALAPEITVELTKRDKLTYYKVLIDDETVGKQIESYQANYGSYDDTADEVDEKDLIKGVVTELENGAPKEGGILVEDAVLMPMYVKDEEVKKKFLGAKKDEKVIFNPHKAYQGAEPEIAAFLKIDKENVAATDGDFSYEIKEITRYKPAALDQTLFDKVFGEGVVTTEDDFRARVKESIEEQFAPQSDFKFLADARKTILKKAGDVKFADDILKRWLLVADEKKTKEKVDEEYPQVVEDLTYHLAKESIVKKNGIQVNDADIALFGRKVAKAQFAQYGMLSVPDDVLDNYAKDMLKNKDTLRNVVDRAIDDKVAAWLKGKAKVEEKEVSVEDFDNLFKEK